MQSPCIREASQACLRGCCRPPFLGLPDSSQPAFYRSSAASTPAHNFLGATETSLHPYARFSDHESIPSLKDAFTYFIRAYPLYSDTQQIDRIRADEYNHLALSKHVGLDYNGQCLFSWAQQQSFPMAPTASSSSPSCSPSQFLHSPGSPFFNISHRSVKPKPQVGNGGQESEFESRIRSRIMKFMNLSEDDYAMVFTANQSSAFKLLADTYPFQRNRNLVTVYDHKSEAVEVMVESSSKKGARISSAEFLWPNLTISSGKLRKLIVSKRKKKRKTKKRGLFVFPLQSRLTGTPYSYQWLNIARENEWDVCLDACALGPKDMETLGLSLFKPEFLISSFYKIFGENPSGFGCLFIKKANTSVMEDLITSPANIGVISLISTSPSFPFPEEPKTAEIKTEQSSKPILQNGNLAMPESSTSPEIVEASEIEERELSFTGLVELGTPFESARSTNTEMGISRSSKIHCRGLDHADSVGLRLISIRARYLINWLTNALTNLQHPNAEEGLALVRIYGPKIEISRGPAVAFNVFDWKGEKVDPALVQKLADRSNISLSHGFLNHVTFSDKNEEDIELRKETVADEAERTDRTEKRHCWISVVTAALGFLTNFEDVYRLWAFVSRFLDADFVEKERWRYMALNQKTIEV